MAFDLFEESREAPVSFTILLDGSGSMGLAGKLEGAASRRPRPIAAAADRGRLSTSHVFSGEVREVIPFTTEHRGPAGAVGPREAVRQDGPVRRPGPDA